MTNAPLTLAHSPDADDLVMWWPLTGMRGHDGAPLEGLRVDPTIKTEGFEFKSLAADIHTLNERAVAQRDLDITAISAFTYPFVARHYRMTRCGGSFGDGYGPKIVVRHDSQATTPEQLGAAETTFAVPGDRTTAFLALRILLGRSFQYVVVPFKEVGDAINSGAADAGLLIHEAQLTFEDQGLKLITDLGAWWKDRTDLPLPLGLNVIRRDLDDRFGGGSCRRVADALYDSVREARSNPAACRELLLRLVGERPEWADDDLVDRYLGMYVNELTQDMGERGIQALKRLYRAAFELNLCPDPGPLDPI